ncbi:MAG: V/A-type H+/Na+-transporting ATPase subunit, partial [Euryarchaeota archaeon]|nr:V/A-type H+/Na+-transporting ATPase subunit [Euryarchaeota archaeon]
RNENRTIADTLDVGWKILAHLPINQLGRIDNKYIQKYHPAHRKAQ